MKKLSVLVLLLFLTACSRMSGPTLTSCVDLAGGLVRPGVGESILEIEGFDETIITWTVSTTMTRAEFNDEFLGDIYLSDEEIHDLFAHYNLHTITGVIIYISELTSDYVTIRRVYNYGGISEDDLNRLWSVEDFNEDVNLSSAIEGLIENGATCTTVEVEMVEE